jgi:hypothetical protein
MKKIFIAFAIMTMFVSCGNRNTKTESTPTSDSTVVETVDSLTVTDSTVTDTLVVE